MITKETLAALAESRRQTGHLIDGATNDIITAWLKALKETQDELRRVLAENPFDVHDRVARLEQSQQVIAERIAEVAEETRARLTPEAERMVNLAAAQQEALIATQLPPGHGISFTRPGTEAVNAMVQRTTEQITVRSYYLSKDATLAVQEALRIGVAGGLGPDEIAQRMIDRVDGVFHGGMARATVIARTEMMDTYLDASLQSRLENADIMAGWEWFAHLDSDRTCISCIAQHGTRHPFDEPGPLDHHQGRCDALPVTKTWRELGIDIDEPPGTEIETGVDWFHGLDEDKQRSILGPKRFEAWQDGRFPPEMWSQRRSSEGWRDAYHVGKPLEPDGD